MNGAPVPRGGYEPPQRLLQKLEAYVSPWWEAKTDLNRRRCAILRACLAAGRNAEKGLFTLTVPTGGGKTVSSLAFALSMAAAQRMERIIYVIPYTSIIDQNAAVFTEILGDGKCAGASCGSGVCHGEGDGPAEYRKALAAENWDVPVVVTTAVQFLSRCTPTALPAAGNCTIWLAASLYSTRPRRCRCPICAPVWRLLSSWCAIMVRRQCSAPPPSPHWNRCLGIWPPICRSAKFVRRQNGRRLFSAVPACGIWGELTREAMAGRLNAARQVLCVLNRRKTVQELYTALEEEGRYCLTTLLYPAHRKRLLDEIRARLKAGCLAGWFPPHWWRRGVDLDFPEAYRELAGLDSICKPPAAATGREGGRRRRARFTFFAWKKSRPCRCLPRTSPLPGGYCAILTTRPEQRRLNAILPFTGH